MYRLQTQNIQHEQVLCIQCFDNKIAVTLRVSVFNSSYKNIKCFECLWHVLSMYLQFHFSSLELKVAFCGYGRQSITSFRDISAEATAPISMTIHLMPLLMGERISLNDAVSFTKVIFMLANGKISSDQRAVELGKRNCGQDNC